MAKREMTPEEKAEHGRKVQAGRARGKAERAAQSALDPAEAVAVIGGSVTPAPTLGELIDQWEMPQSVGEPDLSPEEYERIASEVARKIASEVASVNSLKRTELIKRRTELELQRQRREAGLADHRDDIMEILVDVAPFAKELVWDGTIYQHGRWYKVSRRVYDSMRETMARSWDAEERAGNPNRLFRRDPKTGSMNPMMRELRLEDGTLSVYGDIRINARTGAVAAAPPQGVA